MTKNIFGVLILILSGLISCRNEKKNDDSFFSEYKGLGKNAANKEILIIDSAFIYNTSPAYKMEFNSWKGIIVNDNFVGFIPSLKGYIYYKNEAVYYMKDVERKSDQHALLFDFNSKMDSINQYDCSFNDKVISYKIQLEKIFFTQNDSIYKFKFFNVGRFSSDNMDLVCYVNKLKGILGMYVSYYNSETLKDEVYSEWGELYDKSQLTYFKGVVE